MEKYNKLLRNIAELIEKGLFTSKDLKKEVEDSLKFKIETIANTPQPSSFPINPKPSVVVAFTHILERSKSNILDKLCIISGIY